MTIERGDAEHEIHTRDEADELGIDYVPWEDATEGQWAFTDDGYVAECIRRWDAGKRSRIDLSFGAGLTMQRPRRGS